MIDTERAEVDLRNTVRRLRFYLNKLKEKATKGEMTRAERNLAHSFKFGLREISDDARSVVKEERRINGISQ